MVPSTDLSLEHHKKTVFRIATTGLEFHDFVSFCEREQLKGRPYEDEDDFSEIHVAKKFRI